MSTVAICMPCSKHNCTNCLYETNDPVTREVTVCDCDEADHILCSSCHRPLLDPGCEHAEICAGCIGDFKCEDCAREDQQ